MDKNSFQLGRIKTLAIRLRSTYQLPKYLVYLINNLSKDDSSEKVKYLCDLTEHYLRVKGYYKKYSELSSQIDDEIRKDYERRYPLNECSSQ